VKRIWALALAVCLLAPAVASAKGGVMWDRYPDVQAVGSPMKFTVLLAWPKPIEGVRPLISFRDSATGQVVRVRASRSDLNGIAYGTARLPSTGPWDTVVTVAGKRVLPADAEPFRVGVGLTQTIPSADAEHAASRAAGSGDTRDPWLWITSAAAIGSALLVLVMRRRGRWGAA
jgi:hypothetical protein